MWSEKESSREKYWLDWLDAKPFTTLFIDGNHENHERLSSFPVEKWHGGNVHRIRPSVIHLMRGQVFEINERKFFAFGGARSHDINFLLSPKDPEFEASKSILDKAGIFYRIKGRNWWESEFPTEDERAEGIRNLARTGNKVDFIITHDAPASALALYSHGAYKSDKLNEYFEGIRQNTEFSKWFFGHYHDDRCVGIDCALLYEQITRIQ